MSNSFALFFTQFHWLRPAWLLAFIPLIAIAVLLWKHKRQAYQWQDMIAPELLPFLLDGKTVAAKRSLLWGLFLAWTLTTIALAGPTWLKRPTPVEKNQSALVILLDLSISMITEDVKPSRLVRARLKIADILRERKDGQTALVVYAGEAHTVTPLSDDSATIVSLLPSLHPNIMPLQGSNTEDAVKRAIDLLHDAGAPQGDILLITDGVVPDAFSKIRELIGPQPIHLHILGVGSNQPAPLPSSNGGFVHDKSGAIVTTQLNANELSQLATSLKGRYRDIENNSSDIDFLLPTHTKDQEKQPTLERDFDQWFDQGHWLVFFILPIILWSFRRGFILVFVWCIPLLGFAPNSTYALGFDDMWMTKDQQAATILSEGKAKEAADQFESTDWKAAAQYRAGDFAAAAENYAKIDSASGHYNRGNALAKAGKLDDAIKAYDEALKRDSNLEKAKKNRELVEKILKQQKEQQKDQQKNSDNNKDKKDNKDQDKKDQDKNDQQNQENQKNDQQNEKNSQQQDQKNQDQQSADKNQQNEKQKNDEQASEQGQQNSSGVNQSAQNQPQKGKQSSSEKNAQQAQEGQSSAAGSAMNQAAAAHSSAGNEKDKAVEPVDPNQLTPEQRQALEQWLRRVPDDPGGLLRNKFKWQYQQNRQMQREGNFQGPDNKADQRW